MAADRTVPCDHLIRRESSWKAESVIGWSAAQHELGGSGCPNRNQMAKFHEKKKKDTGEKRCPQRWDFVISIALKSGLLAVGGHKEVRKDENVSSHFPINCVQPPSQTTGSHKTEFVFDVRQFGVLQRAQLHFSTPILYTEQLKTTSKKKNPTKKERKKSNSPPNWQF